jgi:diacylglycerol O-acyltransferase
MLGRLAPEDAARLRMGTRANPMVIGVLIVTDGIVDDDALRERVLDLVRTRGRFRARVSDSFLPLRAPRWARGPFDLDAHLERVSAQDASDEALSAVVGERLSAPLDARRPLWDLLRVDRAGAGTAIVARIHHCIADGFALVRVLYGLTDEGAAMTAPELQTPRGGPKARSHIAGAMRRALALRADSPSALRSELTGTKRVAFTRAFPLDKAKRAAHALGATVNDLAGGATAGALRAVLGDVGPLPARLRALVPVHGADDGADGNHYASVFVPLPIHEPDPAERVRAFKRDMDAMKRTGASLATRRLIALASLSGAVERAGVRVLSRSASVMFGNVPGAPIPLTLCGRRIAWMVHWAPTPGSIGLGVNVHGYAGSLRIAVSADAGVRVDANGITRAIEAELEALGA